MIGLGYGFGYGVARRSSTGGYPPITHILEVGDSITDRSTGLDTTWNAVHTNPSGWGAALRIVSGQRLQGIERGATGVAAVPGNDRDFGYSGINAEAYLIGSASAGSSWLGAHVPIEAVEAAAASAPPGTVIVCHIGTNDIGSFTASQVAGRVEALWERLVATGLRVIGTDILQRTATASGWTSTLRDRVNDTNTLLRAAWQSAGLWAYRQWDDLIDKDGSGYAAATEFPVDGLHPASRTGFLLATDLWSFLQPFVEAAPYAIPASGSASWVTPNPYVAGGATLATSWVAYSLGTDGVDYTFQKTTDGDGTVWQRVNKTRTDLVNVVGLYSRITSGIPAAGTMVRATARFRVAEGEPVESVTVYANQVGAPPVVDIQTVVTDGGSAATTSPIREVDGSWRWLSEPFDVKSGVTQLWIIVAIKNSGAAVIEFTEAGIFLEP